MTAIRLQSAYRYVAFTLFNTTLIIAVITAVSWGIVLVHDPKPKPYSSFLHESAMHTMPAAEARKFFREFDRMGEHETYLYQPWLGFSERVFHSERLNVDEEPTLPTRHTVNPTASPDKRDFVIWMFGGSTMFGWGVPDNQTIASHLASVLARRMPDRNVVVVNHGHSWYYSSQEVLLFQMLLRRGQRCDAAIFFHGTNDILGNGEEDHPAFAGDMADMFLREQSFKRSRFLRISPAFPPVRLTRAFIENLSPPAPKSKPPVFDVLGRYQFNVEIASAAGRVEHIPTYFFWQPIPPLNVTQRRENIARVSSVIHNPEFHFIGDLFDHDELKGIYLDHFHYGDFASARLAETIASIFLNQNGGGPRQKINQTPSNGAYPSKDVSKKSGLGERSNRLGLNL